MKSFAGFALMGFWAAWLLGVFGFVALGFLQMLFGPGWWLAVGFGLFLWSCFVTGMEKA